MLRGAALVQALEISHPLLNSLRGGDQYCCFETFPHAITWHLRGGNAKARQKRLQRRALLEHAGIDTAPLPPGQRLALPGLWRAGLGADRGTAAASGGGAPALE